MHFISENNLAALIGTSNATVQRWGESGIYPSHQENGLKGFFLEELENIPEVKRMLYSCWDEELDTHPIRKYTSIELFAGCGGLALGLSMAGFTHVLLNEYDHSACNTLRVNRPEWNIIERDVCDIDFTPLRDKVDFLSGGFPCQAFSYAGKQGGFNDTRGTLFFELARAVKEIRPKVFMGENVKGLISHDNGRTFNTIKNTIAELGYTLVEPRVLKAVMYQVKAYSMMWMYLFQRVLSIQSRNKRYWIWCLKVVTGVISQKKLQKNIWEVVGFWVEVRQGWRVVFLLMSLLLH